MKGLMAANYELRSRTRLRPRHAGVPARARRLRRAHPLPHQRRLGAAARRDEGFYGLGFNFFEGYGLTETAPVLTVTSPKDKPIPGSVGQPLPGHRGQDRQARRDTGVGEVIARGRNVMAGYWEDEARPPPASRTAGSTPATSAASTTTATLSRRPLEGHHRRLERQERLSRRDRGFLPRLALHQGALGGRSARRQRRADRLRGRPRPRARRDAEPRRGARAHRGALPQDLDRSAVLEAGQGVHIWDGDLPKTAKRSIKRRDVVAELARLRRKNEETEGRARARPRASAGRSPGCSTRSRPRRGAGAPTSSWAAASASWASTA